MCTGSLSAEPNKQDYELTRAGFHDTPLLRMSWISECSASRCRIQDRADNVISVAAKTRNLQELLLSPDQERTRTYAMCSSSSSSLRWSSEDSAALARTGNLHFRAISRKLTMCRTHREDRWCPCILQASLDYVDACTRYRWYLLRLDFRRTG